MKVNGKWARAAVAALLAGAALLSASCKKGKPQKSETGVSIDAITLGEDYADIKANLKMLTHRTDVIDTWFKRYLADFQKMYPNVNVEFEGITNYAPDMMTRLTTGDWGDICMIPTAVDKSELGNYFAALGTKDGLSTIYNGKMLDNYAYGDTVYGVASMANAQGIVYNKKVLAESGAKAPKTPDEFISALQMIKDNTNAIPLYTNFAASWTLTAWDAYTDSCATGDPDFVMNGLVKGTDPFADRGDGTGPYAVYNILYEAVSRHLTEDDPTTTDWEGCKGQINSGKIGFMVLGSWAVPQMQAAGPNADDIGYMAFPISVNGKQYAAAGPDYCYGVNCNSSADNQAAAICFVKYLVEKSGYAQDSGAISVVLGSPLPSTLDAMSGVELVVNNPAPAGEENLFNDVNNESELGINVSGYLATTVVEDALEGSKTMDEIAADWNAKWTAAQDKLGIERK